MKIVDQKIIDTGFVKDLWDNELQFYPNGVLSRRVPSGRVLDPSRRSNRGEIKGFSRHSVLRLRKTLLTRCLDNPFSSTVGLTLTLPWRVSVDSVEIFDKLHHDYKTVFNRFTLSFRRRFSGSVAVFRHELQRRKVPHCHMVCYVSDFDFDIVDRPSLDDFRTVVYSMWLRALSGFDYDLNLSAFHKRGVKVDLLNGNIAMFRYLCDHASKGKVSQLGYHGKQWGIINRRLLVPIVPRSVKFNSVDDKIVFYRHVGKVCRFFIPCSCVFGRKLSSSFGRRSVVFVDQKTSSCILSALDRGVICKLKKKLFSPLRLS